VQNLAMVRPASLGDLVRIGENLFRPLAEPEPVPAAQRRVAGGYVETSGVQPAREMVRLIEASRAIESNLSMMQAQDQMLSALVNRVMRS
jgi:flagellar basal body rod protein FlgG